VCYYQHLVDHWDLDHPFERILVDTAVAPNPRDVSWINPKVKPGERRKVVTGIPGKTGVVYTLDRTNGEFLWARPTVAQNVISTIEGNGAVIVNREALWTKINEEKVVCPSASSGGKNWPAGAYSPLTNTMFFPLQNTCAMIIHEVAHVFYGSHTEFAAQRKHERLWRDCFNAVLDVADESDDAIVTIMLTKSRAWKYEDEYRLIAQERAHALGAEAPLITDDSSLPLSDGSLQAIIVGCLADNATLDAVRGVVGEASYPIALKRAVKVPNQYKLVVTDVT
jgi:hypothetical protein